MLTFESVEFCLFVMAILNGKENDATNKALSLLRDALMIQVGKMFASIVSYYSFILLRWLRFLLDMFWDLVGFDVCHLV